MHSYQSYQELGVSRRDLRQQGGWKGDREDLMPDTYSRASQQRSLLLQEKVLNHLRSGGRLSGQVLESSEGPTLDAPIPAEPSPDEEGATTILPEQTSGMDVPFPDSSPAMGDGHSDVLSDSDESDSAVSRDLSLIHI